MLARLGLNLASMASIAAPPAPAPAHAAPAAPAVGVARVLGVPLRVAGLAAVLALLAALVAFLRPHLARPLGAVALGLALFWVRWRFFRVEGVAGVPFSRASRALLRTATKAKTH